MKINLKYQLITQDVFSNDSNDILTHDGSTTKMQHSTQFIITFYRWCFKFNVNQRSNDFNASWTYWSASPHIVTCPLA